MDSIEDVQRQLDEGDYYLVLGVSPGSDRMTVDLAAESLSAAHPAIAGKISNIVQIMVHPKNKEIYGIACELRDRILQTIYKRYGNDLRNFAPNVKFWAWVFSQRLLNCNFEQNQIGIAVRMAESLIEEGLEWTVEDVLNHCLPVLPVSHAGKIRGIVDVDYKSTNCSRCDNARYLNCKECGGLGRIKPESEEPEVAAFIEDMELLPENLSEETGEICESCRGAGRFPCDCIDRYRFRVSLETKPGTILQGRGLRTGRFGYAILDYAVTSPRPNNLLMNIYGLKDAQQKMEAWMTRRFPKEAGTGVLDTQENGMRIDEYRSLLSRGYCAGILLLLLISSSIGNWAGSWLLGLFIGVSIIILLAFLFKTPIEKKYRRYIPMSLLLLPLYGAGIGYLFDLSRAGIIVGAGMLTVLLAVFFATQALSKR